MLGNLILVTGVGLISTAFILRRKEDKFRRFFNQIQRSQNYHLDFVDDISKLPTNKPIIIFGVPKSTTSQQAVICQSIIKRTQNEKQQKAQPAKQFTMPSEDRLWKFNLRNKFYMEALSKQKIQIVKHDEQRLYAFNLLRKQHNQKYEKRVIVKNQPLCVFGNLVKSKQGYSLKSRLFMGVKSQNFLTYLDNSIIKINKTNRYLTMGGTAVLLAHFVYTSYSKQQVFQNHEKILPKSPQLQLLNQMQQFSKKKA